MNKKSILFFPSHQPNPRFVKQINYLAQNNDVSVVYFFREYAKDLFSEYSKNTRLNENLGTIVNKKYLKRVVDYINAIGKLRKILKSNRYDILICNNIDVLILFKIGGVFLNQKVTTVIEISDLRPHSYRTTLKATLLKKIEKFMFGAVDKLIVTSPKFYEIYYHEIFKSEPFVLENKPLSSSILNKVDRAENKKIIIGIIGLLLQERPYRVLFETLKDNDKYEIHIHGKGTYQKMVEDYANKYDNIRYFGEYNFFQDSAKIYASIDIIYMGYDTQNGSLNNKIALPNRFYEAMYFGVPAITSEGTYLGELVEKYKVGEVIECCNQEAIVQGIEKIVHNKLEFDDRFKKLPKELYIADNDYIQLERYILEGKQ